MKQGISPLAPLLERLEQTIRPNTMRMPASPSLLLPLGLLVVSLLLGCKEISPKASPEPPAPDKKLVFAHYMICFVPDGSGSLVEKYQKEIRAARARGIDGFALNCGGWSLKEPIYKERTLQMYEAARQLGSEFKLMISADFSSGLTNEEATDMVETFRSHPAQFVFRGKPVLSTFAGNKAVSEFVAGEFTGDRSIFFVPYYYPKPANELPDEAQIEQVFQEHPSLDGFFYFGAAGSPSDLARVNRQASMRWKKAGKVFMASVTPFYRGLKGNYRTFESSGYEGLIHAWQAAIDGNADWVEIVTWNDWNESSYVSPFQPNALPSHSGFLDLSAYYIEWFKSGRAPQISKDQVFYAYRPHPKTLPGRADPANPKSASHPSGHASLADHIYVTALLTAPATLEVKIHDAVSRFDLPAGVTSLQAPFSLGVPEFRLIRDGQTVLQHRSEQEISSDTSANFNYFSGSTTAP